MKEIRLTFERRKVTRVKSKYDDGINSQLSPQTLPTSRVRHKFETGGGVQARIWVTIMNVRGKFCTSSVRFWGGCALLHGRVFPIHWWARCALRRALVNRYTLRVHTVLICWQLCLLLIVILIRSRDSVSRYSDWLRAGRPRSRSSSPGRA
jgi:hypothetical protein